MESALREGGRQPGLRLIETVLWDGTSAPRWPRHAARAARGADGLGWPSPVAAMERALASRVGPGPARLRLTADRQGQVEVEAAPLPPPAALWRVGIAGARLSSADPWLSVKTTNRAAYDRARATLADGLDEALFLNERGEVCDGTITTVFFDRGQGMRTPPVSSGLLPGVLRSELGCPEEVLAGDALPGVRLWVGNAVRGLIPAVFVAG